MNKIYDKIENKEILGSILMYRSDSDIDELEQRFNSTIKTISKLKISGIRVEMEVALKPMTLDTASIHDQFITTITYIDTSGDLVHTFDCGIIDNGNLLIEYNKITYNNDIILDIRRLNINLQDMFNLRWIINSIINNDTKKLIYDNQTIDKAIQALVNNSSDLKERKLCRSDTRFILGGIIDIISYKNDKRFSNQNTSADIRQLLFLIKLVQDSCQSTKKVIKDKDWVYLIDNLNSLIILQPEVPDNEYKLRIEELSNWLYNLADTSDWL